MKNTMSIELTAPGAPTPVFLRVAYKIKTTGSGSWMTRTKHEAEVGQIDLYVGGEVVRLDPLFLTLGFVLNLRAMSRHCVEHYLTQDRANPKPYKP